MAKTEAAVPTPEVAPKPEEALQGDLAPQRDLAPPTPEAALPSDLVEVAALSVVDEFHGQGGSYLLDPATGIRTLVERTKPASL
jgi:hypothetical protein